MVTASSRTLGSDYYKNSQPLDCKLKKNAVTSQIVTVNRRKLYSTFKYISHISQIICGHIKFYHQIFKKFNQICGFYSHFSSFAVRFANIAVTFQNLRLCKAKLIL